MDARTLVIALLCLALGVGAGWALGRAPADSAAPSTPDALDAPPEAPEADAPALRRAEGDPAALRQDLVAARGELRAVAAERDRLREEVAALRKDVEAGRLAAGEAHSRGARFGGDRYKAALAEVDWEEAGRALSRMTPLMGEFIESRLAGGPLPPSVGDIQKYNGALVKIALAAQRDGLPGTGTNGSFTHVAMAANLVYATLAQAGKPLDEAQTEQLARLADDFVAEDERRLASYDERTPALKKLYEEAALKDRFYAGVDSLVTAEQREILHPEALRGRTSFDLFSSGLLWAQHVAPQRIQDRAQLVQGLVNGLVGQYGLGEARRGMAEEVAEAWVASIPARWIDRPVDALARDAGAIEVIRVKEAAVAQLAAFERLMQRLPADDPVIAKLRSETRVAVPLRLEP